MRGTVVGLEKVMDLSPKPNHEETLRYVKKNVVEP